MALINVLKIASDGLQAEHDPSTDELNLLNLQLGGTEIGANGAGVAGPTVINDDSSNYTNFTPAGDTLRETLEAIDSALGSISVDHPRNFAPYTNAEGATITVGQAVYVSAADSVALADASVASEDDPIGLVADATILNAAVGNIVTDGLALGVITGATAGTKYFLQATPGVISPTVPGSGNNVVLMGIAKNATDLQLRIQNIGKKI